MRRWVLLLAALAVGPAIAADLSLAARRADFATLWTTVEEQYVYLGDGRAAWASLPARYAARVERADTADAWSALIEDALDELRDFHVGMNPGSAHTRLAVPTSADLWAVPDGDAIRVTAVRPGSDAARAGLRANDRIERIDGAPVPAAIAGTLGVPGDQASSQAREWAVLTLVTGRRAMTRTFDVRTNGGTTRTVALPAQRRFDRPDTPVTWRRTPDDIGVIRFNNSIGEVATVAAFDAALSELRSTRGLVLDLRDVPSGGNSTVALGVLGRFTDARKPYQRHRIPRYGRADVERNWLEEVAPRGPFAYRAPLVVLVGRWTGSMGEGMAIGLDGMGRATVLGSAMAGLAGATDGFTLPRTEVRVSLPTEELYHVDGTPRHRWRPRALLSDAAAEDDEETTRRATTIIDAAAPPK